MSFLELAASKKEHERLRSILLTVRDIEHALNIKFGNPGFEKDPIGTDKMTTMAFDIFEFLRILTITEDKMSVAVDITVIAKDCGKDQTDFLRAFFGKPYDVFGQGTCTFFKWQLPVKEWPFIAVELLADTLFEQKGNRQSVALEETKVYMNHHFPHASYEQLASWHANDLLPVTDLNEFAGMVGRTLANQKLWVQTSSMEPPQDLTP